MPAKKLDNDRYRVSLMSAGQFTISIPKACINRLNWTKGDKLVISILGTMLSIEKQEAEKDEQPSEVTR